MEAEGGEALPTTDVMMLDALPTTAPIVEAPTASDCRWHVLWTRSNCERLVCDQLTARGFHLFLPQIETWTRVGGERRRARLPMFPGYLFLHHAMDKAAYLTVCQVLGLVRVLGERWDRLATVPEPEISALQRVVQAHVPIVRHSYLQVGQRVRVTRGPLIDVEGVLVRSKPNKGFVVISVDMLQRSIAVEVDCTLVEAV